MCDLTKQNLKKLEELTDKLPPIPTLSNFSSFDENSNIINYTVNAGTAIGFQLLSEPKIVIQKTFLSIGTLFPLHTHNQSIEYLLVYDGKLKISFENGDISIIGEKEQFCVKPNRAHKVQALEDTWAIAIIIPREADYPTSNERN